MFQMPVRLLDEDAPGGTTHKIQSSQNSRPESPGGYKWRGGGAFAFSLLYIF